MTRALLILTLAAAIIWIFTQAIRTPEPEGRCLGANCPELAGDR